MRPIQVNPCTRRALPARCNLAGAGACRRSAGRLIALALLAGLWLAGCGGGGGGSSASPPAPPPPPPLPKAFVDATQASGIAFGIGYRIPPPPSYLSAFAESGVAAGDYDNDGDIDLFIVRGDVGPNLLYRNNGLGVFVDVAAAANLAYTATPTENYRHTGPAFADMDGDGDLDLFIGGLWGDPSLIYRNEGDAGNFTFTDVTAGSGIDTLLAEQNISAAFGDYDLDGDLDLFVAHWGTERDMQNPGDTEHLWRNDTNAIGGPILFTSVSVSAGISPTILNLPDPLAIVRDHDYTFSASFARINDDLYPDLVVVADYNNSMVFINDGNPPDVTFTNVTDVGVITDGFGMGSTLGDYDDDGDLDWFVTAILNRPNSAVIVPERNGNRFYRNDNGVFVDVTNAAGVLDGGWGWGACFMDFENDGDLDIYHTNGYSEEYVNDPSRAFVSSGNGGFAERAASLGLNDTQQGRGIVCADFDNDGDTDIFQLHRALPVSATLWRNDGSANNYVAVKLAGQAPNTEAAGARIFAKIGARTMMREIIIGNNFESQNPTAQIFGLGLAPQVDELWVEWPDGQQTPPQVVAAGQTLTLAQP
jgi:hypothetical protein